MKYKSTLLVLVVSIVCAGGAFSSFAQTGEVYSLNVVGFQKITASSQGLTMVSTPFDKSSNTLDGVVGNQLYGHKSSTYADNINVWDAASQQYLSYFLKNDGKWYDLSNNPATGRINTAMGFWILNNRKLSNEVVVVSGDVVADSVITNRLLPGLNLVSYPFSTEVDINKSGLTNGYGHKSSTYADNLLVWDAVSQMYVTYYLKNTKIWYTIGNQPASNVMVGAGKGFWYYNQTASAFAWAESKPYTL